MIGNRSVLSMFSSPVVHFLRVSCHNLSLSCRVGWLGFGSAMWGGGGRVCRTLGHQLDHPGGEVAAVPEGVSQALPRHGPQESRLDWLVSYYKTMRDYSVPHLVQFFSFESFIVSGKTFVTSIKISSERGKKYTKVRNKTLCELVAL